MPNCDGNGYFHGSFARLCVCSDEILLTIKKLSRQNVDKNKPDKKQDNSY